ncbi:MAG: zinc ribbon domain-containing protein [Nitrospinota bacterium]|nr:zinc ribbon domain-containing protein [Nitrospinota bacterium]
MPMYEFECRECGERFERLLTLHESLKTQQCPHCDKKSGERLLSAPSLGRFSSSGDCGPTGFG